MRKIHWEKGDTIKLADYGLGKIILVRNGAILIEAVKPCGTLLYMISSMGPGTYVLFYDLAGALPNEPGHTSKYYSTRREALAVFDDVIDALALQRQAAFSQAQSQSRARRAPSNPELQNLPRSSGNAVIKKMRENVHTFLIRKVNNVID